ncbi:hypothetical protein [Paraburkholderia sp. MM6662-R1]|uniref:hypothetical protein n=1 Tax=Paraburkholderia sp. MM6662-R1 TaxID=2991066 RepID=UPI003D1C47F3
MPLDAAQEAAWAAQREQCWSRFCEAVSAAHRGSYRAGWALVDAVRARFGDEVAERAQRELRRYTARSK